LSGKKSKKRKKAVDGPVKSKISPPLAGGDDGEGDK
jgi:hypothetical protein